MPASLLSAALTVGEIWGNLPRGVATVTAAPAAAAGLPDRGSLAIGLRADVIRVARIGTAASLRGAWVLGQRVA